MTRLFCSLRSAFPKFYGEIEMILSAIEKKAYKRGSEEKAKEIYERMLELGFSKDLARKAVYSDSKLSKEQNSQ